MTRTGSARKGRRYSYYTCAGAHATGVPGCKGRHMNMAKVDGLVVAAVCDRLLEPTALTATLEVLISRQDRRAADVKSRLATLAATQQEAKARLERLYNLVARACEPPDEVLLERIALRRRDHESASEALSRAKAMVRPKVAIDALMLGKFSSLMKEKLANGDIQARKSYLRFIIDVVEIDYGLIRIVGRRSTLRNAISGPPGRLRKC